MTEFDDFVKGLSSDIKTAAEQLGKKADETFEISKRRAERVRLKGRIQHNYQLLGEMIYGEMKNGEDVSEEKEAIIGQLDADFERIEIIFDEINAIKNGTFVKEEAEPDWEEEYAEEYDIEEAEEAPSEEVIPEEEAPEAKTEAPSAGEEFDINAD